MKRLLKAIPAFKHFTVKSYRIHEDEVSNILNVDIKFTFYPQNKRDAYYQPKLGFVTGIALFLYADVVITRIDLSYFRSGVRLKQMA
jgi:hypothetical protein